ncbi:MAG: hypothetical protein R2769_03395 [Saprospiraceae bacterium]
MLRIFTFSLFLTLTFSVTTFAQLGVTAYVSQSTSKYFQTDQNLDPFQHAGAALHYWFRINETRVEFFPEIGFTKGSFLDYPENGTSQFTFIREAYQSYFFRIPTRFYVLDFEGDCNCPTFSKQGTFFKKGFFLMLAPGVQMANFPVDYGLLVSGEEQKESFSRTGVSWSVAGGLGLDIGISDAITITPMVLLEKTGNFSLIQCLVITVPNSNIDADFLTFSGGLSIHYRWQR